MKFFASTLIIIASTQLAEGVSLSALAQLNAATASNLSIMSHSKCLADSEASSGAQICDQNGRANSDAQLAQTTAFGLPSMPSAPSVPKVETPKAPSAPSVPSTSGVTDQLSDAQKQANEAQDKAKAKGEEAQKGQKDAQVSAQSKVT